MRTFNKSNNFNSEKNLLEEKNNNNDIEKEQNTKNIRIIQTYGKEYLKFFKEESNSLPMFLDSTCPRALKRVVMAHEVLINSGESVGIYYNPFQGKGNLVKFTFSSSAISQKLDTLSSHLTSYSSYKVVATYIKMMQQSILSMNDGFGTTLDAIIAPSTFDPITYGQNCNNVNVSFFNRVNTVDGRKGIKGMLIGTPFQPTNYPSEDSYSMSESNLVNGDCYLPYGTIIQYVGPTEIEPLITLKGGTQVRFKKMEVSIPIINIDSNSSSAAVFCSRVPDESIFYAKISVPSASVSYRIFIEAVMEVVPIGNLLEEIPMFTPLVNYSTVRLKQAFQQSFPQLIEGNILNQGIFPNQCSYKRKKIKYNKFEENDQDDDIYFASDNKSNPRKNDGKNLMQRKKILSQNKEVRIVQTPKFIIDACAYLNLGIYENLSGTEYTKLMRGASQTMAEKNYQFFPLINENEEDLGIFCLKVLEKLPNGVQDDDIEEIYTYDAEGNEGLVKVLVDTNELCDKDVLVEDITNIIKFLNVKLYFPFPKIIQIKVFAPKKFKGQSYMMSLLALLAGAPCGTIATGKIEFTVTEEDITYKIEKMNLEDLKQKSKLCTPDNPLITGGDYMSGMITLASGVNSTPYEKMNVITCSTIEEFISYLFIPPRLRGYKHNYFQKYASEIKSFLLNKNKEYFPVLAYYLQYATPEEIDSFLKLKKFDINSNYYNKLKESNYVSYISFNKGKQYISVNDILNDDLEVPLKINKNPIYVDKFAYLPQGRLISYLSENNLLDTYKKRMTDEIKLEIKESISNKNNLNLETVIDQVEKHRNTYKDRINKNIANKLNKEVIQNYDKKADYKNLIKEIKELIQKDLQKFDKLADGRNKLITDSDIAGIWGEIGGKNGYQKETLNKLLLAKEYPTSMKILEIGKRSKKIPIPKAKAFLNKIGIKIKNVNNLPVINSNEILEFLNFFKDNMKIEEENEEDGKFEDEQSILEQSNLKLDELDDVFN